MIYVPVSIGELLDKITILKIKKARMIDHGKRRLVEAELEELLRVKPSSSSSEVQAVLSQLETTNGELWDLENRIRSLEAQQNFGEQFVAVSREIRLKNDFRFELKSRLNSLMGSELAEQKEHSVVDTRVP